LFQLGRFDESAGWLARVALFATGDDLIDAHLNRASALLALARHDEALAAVAAALEIDPSRARALSTRAAILRDQLQPVLALGAARQAAAIEPSGSEIWTAIANALQLAGRVPPAIVAYDRAIAISPDNIISHGNKLFTMCFAEGADDRALYRAARAWGRRIEALMPPVLRRRRAAPRPRLRIGYHSFEFFRRSPLDDYFPPVLRRHDRSRFEIVLFADGGRRDARTDELRGLADRFEELAGLDLSVKIDRLRAADLDIAVCLTGYLPIQRLAFVPRVAPVQVAHMNHVATTGLTTFDYRITDAWLDPPGQTEAWNTERLVRIERGYAPMKPPDIAPPISPLPARTNGFITFGSFNNLTKITPTSLTLWSRLMAAVPGSRLLFKARAFEDPDVCANYAALAAAAGIPAAQIDFVGEVKDDIEHLSALGRADIALDPVPFSGGRSTVESLTMGVPVINLRSPSFVGRLGASLLARSGLENLAADTVAEFVGTASALAQDLDRLESLRLGLRDQLRTSILCDVAGYTRELENAFSDMITGEI
jgi:predicted O-linked N-acetylglucosamine transferase (SPINDLY family)